MRTYCQRAFSLSELLVVIAILGILAALMFPALARVKEESKVTACMEGMRNYHRAVMLYRLDYESAETGTIYQMGLPIGRVQAAFARENCAMCKGASMPYYVAHVMREPDRGPEHLAWQPYVARYGDRSLILHTFTFNDPSSLATPNALIRGIGVTLGGSAVSRRGPNDFHLNHLWYHARE